MANKVHSWNSWGKPTVENFIESRNESANQHAYNILLKKFNDGSLNTDSNNLLELDLETLIEIKNSSNQEILLKALNSKLPENLQIDSADIDKLIEWHPDYVREVDNYLAELTLKDNAKALAMALWETVNDKVETAQKNINKHCPWVNDAIAEISENTGEAINNLNNKFPQIGNLLQEISENTGEFIAEFDAIEAAEVGMNGLAGGVTSAFSFAIYSALKEFLSLEGQRRRGKISNSEVIKQVCQIALEASKKGVGIGVIFAIAIMIFGSWLLIPLTVIAPFATIKMSVSLWQSFWDGLDEHQRQELIERANGLGIDIDKLFAFG